jgi:hypothetical protein
MAISSALGTGSLTPGVCTSTTRPTAPFEGQLVYETDTDMMAIWNGTAWRYVAATTPTNGTVLQVVASTYSTSVNNDTTTFADTGLTATITPKSTSSKILVLVSQNGVYKRNGDASNGVLIRLMRNSTSISNLSNAAGFTNTDVRNDVGSVSGFILDSPATTSSVVYKTQFSNAVNAVGTIVQEAGETSSITLMEIAG